MDADFYVRELLALKEMFGPDATIKFITEDGIKKFSTTDEVINFIKGEYNGRV